MLTPRSGRPAGATTLTRPSSLPVSLTDVQAEAVAELARRIPYR
jgi:hypothetical protein